MEPTRVLVTGGCGFLGTAVVSALLSTKRYAITVIDVNPPSLGSTTFTNSVRYVRCDVLDPSSLSSVFSEARPAVVIHTVGVFPLGTSRYSSKGKAAIFKINVQGTRNVVEASRECGAKAFVYTSSVTVVLDELDRDFRNVDERWPTGAVHTSYGQSKVYCISLSITPFFSHVLRCLLLLFSKFCI
jgi:sterol-4alpha-carboxylate 3-dehydrogenase (decarboxylating)